MKKLLIILLAIAIVFSTCAVASAEVENFAKDAKWIKGHAGSIKEKDGVYSATGINAAYQSPFIDILPAVKTALGTDSEIELVIQFKISATFTEDNEGETVSAQTLIRGGNIDTDTVSDWNTSYSEAIDGETFFKSDNGGNIMKYVGQGISFGDDEWTTVTIELSLTDTIVNCDMVKNWYFCIDSLNPSNIIKSINFKDFIVAEYDDSLFEETEPEEIIKEKKEDKDDKEDKNDKPVNTEPVVTPAPGENLAANLKWNGFSGASISEADGVITVSNFKYPYSSFIIDVLPAIKRALGDNDDLEIFFTFESRANFTQGNEKEKVTANTLFRGANALSVSASDVAEWSEEYEDSFEDSDPLFMNSGGNIMKYLSQSVSFSSEWESHVITLEFEAEQILNPALSKWDFCIDGISKPAILDSIEIRNFVITIEEPEDVDDGDDVKDTETPADDKEPESNKPKVEATPTPFVVWQTPIGFTDGQSQGNANNGSSILPIIIGCAVGTVVIVGGIITAIAIKKKKPAETKTEE